MSQAQKNILVALALVIIALMLIGCGGGGGGDNVDLGAAARNVASGVVQDAKSINTEGAAVEVCVAVNNGLMGSSQARTHCNSMHD